MHGKNWKVLHPEVVSVPGSVHCMLTHAGHSGEAGTAQMDMLRASSVCSVTSCESRGSLKLEWGGSWADPLNQGVKSAWQSWDYGQASAPGHTT